MKQVTQRLRDGRIAAADVPAPDLRPEGILVDTRASLLSAGTERKKVETARQSLVGKARSRPDQVRRVLDKAKREGFRETLDAVRAQLDRPSALGYSSAGIVLEAGSRVRDLAPGDRVACGGGDYAVHAEIAYVPGNLAVPIPSGVDFDEAAFATIGSIALHGVRQADARLGERVAVIGLGLVGQLTGQILRAAGCRVIATDLDADLVRHGLASGAADVGYPRGELEAVIPADALECDAVIVTASTPSSDPVTFAARLARDRARVVVVGDVGLEVPRGLYYEKELELRTSRSYGPGRYDTEYEEKGLDYPIGYVRWTERRNMGAFLDLVAGGKVRLEPLITERIPLAGAPSAYERLLSSPSSPLGILLEYPPAEEPEPWQAPVGPTEVVPPASPRAAGVIGAGSFATRILIPGLRAAGFQLEAVASASGLSARAAAEKFGFGRVLTSRRLLEDPGVGLVAIATRHSSHAELAAAGLRGGKAVFVEKPPCLTFQELDDLRSARSESERPLAVGFNRRHAPLAVALREALEGKGPLEVVYRVNAGSIDPDHWLNDVDDGGGRLLGEGCHFVDLACWLVPAPVERVSCRMRSEPGRPLAAAQRFAVTLEFADGSVATILYGSKGSDRLGKEYVEAHAGGRSALLDDFKTLELFAGGRPRRSTNRRGDKGHEAQLEALATWLEGGDTPSPDPLDSMEVTLAALRSAESGLAVSLGAER